jgi:hypothetical protein
MNKELLEKIEYLVNELNWSENDEIDIQIGGCASSGLSASDTANPKWHRPHGTTVYQNDAFIVIKNQSRNPVIRTNSQQ